jgi:hypothetical protein
MPDRIVDTGQVTTALRLHRPALPGSRGARGAYLLVAKAH